MKQICWLTMEPYFLFDLDGTLVNSEPAHFEAHRRVWERLGVDLRLENYIREGVSKDINTFYRNIASRYEIDANLKSAAEQKETEFLELIEGISLVEGVAKFLEAITKHEHKIALVTAGNSFYARKVLTQNRIYNQFTAIVCGEELNRNKPQPEPYLMAMQKLGAAAQECLALEDSDSGMLAAKRAGLFCVGLRHEFGLGQTGNYADLLIDSIDGQTYDKVIKAYNLSTSTIILN